MGPGRSLHRGRPRDRRGDRARDGRHCDRLEWLSIGRAWDGMQDELYATVDAASRWTQGLADTLADRNRRTTHRPSRSGLRPRPRAIRKWRRCLRAGMRPEFRAAFDAWVKTDPVNNPDAPPGPMMMPEYRNAHCRRRRERGEEATEAFEQGAAARAISDKYVRANCRAGDSSAACRHQPALQDAPGAHGPGDCGDAARLPSRWYASFFCRRIW